MLIILLLISIKSFSQIKSVDINALVSMMEGSFSSHEQAGNDADFHDLTLHVKKIWSDRTDGKWLYVEESHSESPDKPTRQYVRRVITTYEGRFEAAEYLIPNAKIFSGEGVMERHLSVLAPDSLRVVKGCAVIYTLMNDTMFEGSSEGKKCLSKKNKKKYITSDVLITKDKIIRWDKVFDQYGNKVSGSDKGGYIFKRIRE